MPREFEFLDRILAEDPLLAASLGITEESAQRPPPERLLAPGRSERPSFRFRTRLDGPFYGLRMVWNTSERRWYLDLETNEGDLLVTGIPMVEGIDLLGPYHGRANVPAGELVVVDTEGQGLEPERFDFLGRSRLIYFAEGQRPELDRIAQAALLLESPAEGAPQCVDPGAGDIYGFQPGPAYTFFNTSPAAFPPVAQGTPSPPPPFDGFAIEGTAIDASTEIVVFPSGQGVTINDLGFDGVAQRKLFSVTIDPFATLDTYQFFARNLPDCDSLMFTRDVICGTPVVDEWHIFTPPSSYAPFAPPPLIFVMRGTVEPTPPTKYSIGGVWINASTVLSITPSGQGVNLLGVTFDAVEERWRFSVQADVGATVGVYDLVITNPGCPGATVQQFRIDDS